MFINKENEMNGFSVESNLQIISGRSAVIE